MDSDTHSGPELDYTHTDTHGKSEFDVNAEADASGDEAEHKDAFSGAAGSPDERFRTEKRAPSSGSTSTQPKLEGDLYVHSVLDCECDAIVCQFSPDGSLLAVGLNNGTIKVFSVDTGSVVQALRDSESILSSLPVTALRFFVSSLSHTLLLATYASGTVKCWYVWGGELLWEIRELKWTGGWEEGQSQRQTFSLSVSSSGEKALTGGSDAAIHLYDLHTHQRLLTCSASSAKTVMDGHRFRVFAVTFHPEKEKEFISGGWDNTIQFWDTRQQHAVRMLSGPHICGDALEIDPAASQILSGSWRKDNTLEVWEYGSGRKVCEVPNDPHGQSRIYTCHWLGHDHILAAGSQSNMLRIVNRHTLLSVSRLLDLPSAIFSSCVCPQGRWMGFIAATSGNRVFLLDRKSLQSTR
ncbi:WD repeat-containing protein 5-like isoform X1 [Scleropages formosus]|uniref:WD repeat-containing protein 5-like n=1 Tax=Scleropages formosus TaxID=113540 RepID=A0A8C9RNZ7_SCLFO|nr:WD repeat-containing protein 5-like isoform X1 [Scleropages formosus]XP_018582826.2 WD repeat-containing protein 5-like isoform X1 [Scleropages formosus]